MPPPAKPCPLCGQMFGSSSIDIHVPQCHAKMVQRWEQAPPRDRGPRPAMPVKRASALTTVGRLQQADPMRDSTAPSRATNDRTKSAAPNITGAYHKGAAAAIMGDYTLPGNASDAFAALQQCRYCRRRFVFDRIARHEQACIERPDKKVKQHTSKPFNSMKQRLGDELAQEIRSIGRTGNRKAGVSRPTVSRVGMTVAPKRNWRQEHRDFVAAMRAARAATRYQHGARSSGLGNVHVAVPTRTGPPTTSQSRAAPSATAVGRRGAPLAVRGAPQARGSLPAHADLGRPTAHGGRILMTNETSADMRAIFGGR